MLKPITFVVLALSAVACGSSSVAPKPVASAPPPTKHDSPKSDHVYMLQFLVENAETSSAPSTIVVSLREGEHASVTLGKNIPLPGAPQPARQDVGMKFSVMYRLVGEDLLFDVGTEVSSYDDAPNIRKLDAHGNAWAPPNKSTLIASIDSDQRRYRLSVTPTRLH